MFEITKTSSFKRDMKNHIRNTKIIDNLKEISRCLLSQRCLPEHYQDHSLKGGFI
ncbi:TPA: hypothetical protein DCZ39_08790 [Patescibacteria group bacterium]|nr:hypothetical protein [Candidatus Gracilibacteria bacterium]